MDKIETLTPWRQLIEPHPDVASGKFHPAGFAVDLAQIAYDSKNRNNVNSEYYDPVEFFARTFLTSGMQRLLLTAIRRISGMGGQPIIKLRTAFGGGKTHSMLALYHLTNPNIDPIQLRDVRETILKPVELGKIPRTAMSVLVGTALNPTKPKTWNGIQSRTLWGLMASQIGGKEGYELVKLADEKGVSPGSETLLELLNTFGPCIVIIDELVAYMRNIYHVQGLPSGSFDSNMTFLQSLTEAINSTNNSILLASIPESDIEIGGSAGKAVLERINAIFDRVKEIWEPVKPLESFEIVRRRLFTNIKNEIVKDDICRKFSNMYVLGGSEFPSESKESNYLERMKAAYPIHPEVFDRLYDDWAAIEGFQRTRGVLRLMAMVIHDLWTRGDDAALIMPGGIPFDAPKVREEIVGYLSDDWHPVLDRDVDGDRSDPKRIDSEYPRLGGIKAARRVARTIFLGSAPSVDSQHVRGVEDVRINLGTVQPGEQISIFIDALGHLMDNLTHLYRANKRYWFDTQPNLLRTVSDRAGRIELPEILNEIEARLKQLREKGDFHAVHIFPVSEDVPDEQEVRLVVLQSSDYHRLGNTESPALSKANSILMNRGTMPRLYKNMLIFIAPDADGSANLELEVRQYLAWKSVIEDAESLNLDAYQNKQAMDSVANSNSIVQNKLQDAYSWLIIPIQNDPTGGIHFETTKLPRGDDGYVIRASKKMKQVGALINVWSPQLLILELKKWFWKDAVHVNTKRLWEDMSKYVYLPRLQDSSVLTKSIIEGLKTKDFFGYASGLDEKGRYLGLKIGGDPGTISFDTSSVLVKPDVAIAQIEVDLANVPENGKQIATTVEFKRTEEPGKSVENKIPTRFFGSIELDSTRLARDAAKVAEEIVQHLTSIIGSDVKVTLEIEANISTGVPDYVINIVSENCKVLKFKHNEFVTD